VAKIPGGYILYARKTLESSIMDKPPLTMKLFTWMLLKANRKSGYRGLDVGQFFTTISDMQEAMSWYIGYRKKTPTKDEIRSCYEALKQATMISTAKTTRGMIVTILNYKTYQDPKNYEGHTEHHNDSATIPATPPHDKQEGVRSNNNNSSSRSAEGTEHARLVDYLRSWIVKNNPKHKFRGSLNSWDSEMERIIRIDERTVDDVKKVIKWCQCDSFWKANIMSVKKLRNQFDQLTLKMSEKRTPFNGPRETFGTPGKML